VVEGRGSRPEDPQKAPPSPPSLPLQLGSRARAHLSTPQLPRLISRASILPLAFKRFPFNNFTYCLTLFSKFFSSFPHGTCSLSVSRHYLALDEVYHPFWAAFPSNPTLSGRMHIAAGGGAGQNTGLSPSLTPCSKGLGPARTPATENATSNYNSGSHLKLPDFKFELFPLHSPLLGESWLVSFPPLTDMLKFSGSSCLI